MGDYKEWEKEVEKTRNHNNKLINEFKHWLEEKKLKPKTVKNHAQNIDFYANGFLVYYEIIPVEKGASQIGRFLGNYFIRKTSWASKYTIQENISSFKKFYTFLNEIGKVSTEILNEMKDLIKEEKEFWLEEVEDYWKKIDDNW